MDELDEFYDFTPALIKSGINVKDVAGEDSDDDDDDDDDSDDDGGAEERKRGPKTGAKPLLTPQDIRAGAGVRMSDSGGECAVCAVCAVCVTHRCLQCRCWLDCGS